MKGAEYRTLHFFNQANLLKREFFNNQTHLLKFKSMNYRHRPLKDKRNIPHTPEEIQQYLKSITKIKLYEHRTHS